MTHQITSPAARRRTPWQWVADTAWQHTGNRRTYPVRTVPVRGTADELRAYITANPHLHHASRPVRIGNRGGEGWYLMQATYTDVAHPVRSPRIIKARRAAARAARWAARVAIPIAAVTAAGWIVQAVWGDQIAAGLRIIAGAAIATVLIAAGILVLRSFTVGHPCPGLHCPNCKGGH